MNLSQKNLRFVFFLTFTFTILFPVLIPSFKLHAFIPFIIILFYKRPLTTCLWGAATCGFILDLLSPQNRLGTHAIIYVLTTGLLYGQRRHFFADSLTTLPIMTFFFSVISSTINAFIYSFFESGAAFSKDWAVTDLVILPIVDAAWAFSVFILPAIAFGKPIRKGKDYFLSGEES